MRRWGIGAATAMVMLVPLGGAAWAAPACYQAKDIEADQGVRLETDIMVLSDICGVDAYSLFAMHNRDAITMYRKQLADYYRRGGDRRPEDTLDRFMTGLANQLSLQNGNEALSALCARQATFLSEAASFNRDQFIQHASDLAAENARSYKKCTN